MPDSYGIHKSANILIVDDDLEVRKVLERGLQYKGFNCLATEKPEESLRLLEENELDIVLADIHMPGLDGLELTKIIKEKYNSDIILMTGHTAEHKYEEAIKAGASDFIGKPLDLNELFLRIKRILWERDLSRKRMEAIEELRSSEKMLRNIIDHSDEIFFVHDTDHNLTYTSPASENMLGYTPEEMKRQWTDVLTDNPINQKGIESTEKAINTGQKQQPYLVEVRHKDGSPRLVEIDESPITGPDGKVIGITGAVRDVTEPLRAEEELRSSEEKYRQLFEMESDALFLIRRDDGQILEVNTAASELYGFTREELLTMKNTDLSAEPGKTREATMQKHDRVPVRYHKKKDGTTFPVEISASHFVWQYQNVHIAAIRDISYRVETEKEKALIEEQLRHSQKMEAIGILSGGIAHDFNNMLAGILGYTEIGLLDSPESHPIRENFEGIKKTALRARDIIRQLLTFSRKTKENKISVDIGPVVKESLKLIRSSIPSSIKIKQNIQDKIDNIFTDPTQIHQVIMNLCINAADAMSKDGGLLEVYLEMVCLDEDDVKNDPDLFAGKFVKLTVKDTGTGIPNEHINKIFDPYFTTKDIYKGTGMGLSVVHGIVKSNGGCIKVQSEPGRGTVFEVFFIATEAVEPEHTEVITDFPQGAETILFVDDEEAIADLYAMNLKNLGYTVDADTSPINALETFKENPERFDLVITDMTMPDMNGVKFANELFEIRKDIPVILCTGYNENISEETALKLGISKYIEKPISIQELALLVRKVLEKDS
jgi:PAS domain S-box-containing protein